MTLATTTTGAVRGAVQHIDGQPVCTFLGIPYAGSPAGSQRFLPPVPVQPWKSTRDCTAPGPMAPQNPDAFGPASDRFAERWDEESCLHLNVWTPAADDAGRPVMVWIHGGAYLTGSNNGSLHDGGALASALDVVVVAVNYRLGALGFLHLPELLGPEYADSSNVALLDHLQALRWVARNIAFFGGDPGNVTLFGESAGAAAVGTLLGMPASEGLFRHAILQSGTAERVRSVEESVRVALEFLGLCGLDVARASELLRLPVGQLLEAQRLLEASTAEGTFGVPLPFQPTVGTPAIPEPPLQAIQSGRNGAVDLLAGTNLNEGSFAVEMRRASPSDQPELSDRVDLMLAREGLDPSAARSGYEEALTDALGHRPNGKELLEAYLADIHYRQPTNRLLAARSGSQGKNFSYLFKWKSPAMGGRLGACHALDIPFVFRRLAAPEAEFLTRGTAPEVLGIAMSSAWANFARSGEPQAAGLPQWPEYGRENRQTMVLDATSRVESDPRGALREFWTVRPLMPPTTRRAPSS